MQLKSDFAVAIVAAGRGERAGGDGPKQYRSLAGIPVIARTVQAFRDWQPDCRIVIVRHNDDGALLADALGDQLATVAAVPGGPSRQASVLCALRALAASGNPPAHVLVHDAARPFVSPDLLDRMMAAIADDPDAGVIPGLPVTETLKKVGDGRLIDQTVPRNNLYRAQTPQAFPFATILELHERAASETEFVFTDDASLYEWATMPVRIIEGDSRNLKLTYPDDFAEAERMLTSEQIDAVPDIRVGHGYDTHQLVAGDSVVLCGVEITHDRSLSGHSDADVGLHALTDALLATIGAGDIGSHFPPSDPQWKGASSDIFLDHAAALVRDAGGRITHCDVTIVCEAPRIGPHRDAMRKAIADTIGIDVGRVSVKATTNEKIGFVGRQEGIVALATATAVFPAQGDISDE